MFGPDHGRQVPNRAIHPPAVAPSANVINRLGVDERSDRSLSDGGREPGLGILTRPGRIVCDRGTPRLNAVVGEDPLDAHATLGEEDRGLAQRSDGAGGPFIIDESHEAEPGGVVDEDLEVVVAVASVAVRSALPPEHAVATGGGHSPQLLVVLVEQHAGMAGDVAQGSAGQHVFLVEAAHAGTLEDVRDGRAGMTREIGQAMRAKAVGDPRSEDGLDAFLRQGARRTEGPGTAIVEAGDTLGAVPPDHL